MLAKTNHIRRNWAPERLLCNEASFGIPGRLPSALLQHNVKVWQILKSKSNQDNYNLIISNLYDIARNNLGKWIYHLKHNKAKQKSNAKSLDQIRAHTKVAQLIQKERYANKQHLASKPSIPKIARYQGKQEGMPKEAQLGLQNTSAGRAPKHPGYHYLQTESPRPAR